MNPLASLDALRERPAVRRVRQQLETLGRRLAFAVETLALGMLALEVLSFLVVRADWTGVAWEWGRFWTHYAQATPEARRPVEVALTAALATASGLIGWARLQAARASWRQKEGASP
jgi:hypothetical protein